MWSHYRVVALFATLLLTRFIARGRTFQPPIFHQIKPNHTLLVVLLVWSIDGNFAAHIQMSRFQSVAQWSLHLFKTHKTKLKSIQT